MSRIRTNLITNRMANGAPTVSNGLVISGVTTSTTFSGSGASLTNLNGSNIASGTVPVARIGTGTKNSSTFYRGDGTFQVVSTDLVGDSSPQLGGTLDESDNLVSNPLIKEPDGTTDIHADVKAICNAVWSTTVKDAWKAKLISEKLA